MHEWDPDKSRFSEALSALGRETGVRYLDRVIVEAMHDDLVATFGGSFGLRDPAGLESALVAPMQMERYSGSAVIPRLGAVLASRIIRNHPFIDGNKRTGFMAMVTFLRVNGYSLSAENAEICNIINAVADRKLDEEGLGAWVERNSVPLQPDTEPGPGCLSPH